MMNDRDFFVPLTLEYYNAYARLIVHAQRFFIISHKSQCAGCEARAFFLNYYKRKNKSEEFFVHCNEILLSLHEFNYIVNREPKSFRNVSKQPHKRCEPPKRRLPKLTPTGEWALVVFDNMARFVVVPEAFVVIVGACPLFLILK